jgi:hypothetical protein
MRSRVMVLARTVAVLLAAAALTGCHEASPRKEPACCPPSPQHQASVSGVLVGIGGPAAVPPRHWAGTIRVRGSAVATFDTDDHGHFSRVLPAGTYRFTATSPSYDGGHGTCRAEGRVRLRAHHPAHVRVVCQLR